MNTWIPPDFLVGLWHLCFLLGMFCLGYWIKDRREDGEFKKKMMP